MNSGRRYARLWIIPKCENFSRLHQILIRSISFNKMSFLGAIVPLGGARRFVRGDAARKEGRIGGRPPKLKPQQQKEIVKLVKRGKKTVADAADTLKGPRSILRIGPVPA